MINIFWKIIKSWKAKITSPLKNKQQNPTEINQYLSIKQLQILKELLHYSCQV